MRTSDYDYLLPDDLIARYPADRRDASRLLVSDHSGSVRHQRFDDLPGLLTGEEVIVVNDTRVLPARVLGRRAGSGGRVELLFVRPIDDRCWVALTRSNRPLRPGARIELPDDVRALVRARQDDGAAEIEIEGLQGTILAWMHRHGALPLPPYLRREAEEADADRYQTVFAAREGAVAAPTAGLHFTTELVQALEDRGCLIRSLTLHVGPGTFRPVTAEDPRQHHLDPEWFDIPGDTADAVASDRPVLAVGTTVVRALEAAQRGQRGIADLLLLPGDELRVVDKLLTNFHLPRSSLLMLVSALAGRDRVLDAYAIAVEHRYRFYSYGDATLWL